MSSHRPEADQAITTTEVSPARIVPAQRAADQAPTTGSAPSAGLLGQRRPARAGTGEAATPAVATPRWSAARVACLPLAALCFYLGTMAVLAALDRVISPLATGAALSSTLAVIAFAVTGVALIGGGVKAMQVALHR